jgi:hypothetical protein
VNQSPSDQGERALPHYRYSAAIRVVLAADSQDEAYRMQQQIADIVRSYTNERVVEITASMLDLHHRPDLDGTFLSPPARLSPKEGEGFRAVHRAICDPARYCARIRSFPAGSRQMEPLERWQTRAVLAALSGRPASDEEERR